MKKFKKSLLVIAVPFLLLCSIAAGDHYFEITKHIDIFVSVYKEIDEQYVDELNHAKLMRKAIDGMLKELDPYTVFYSESEIEDYKFQQTGKYGGIGANVGRRDGRFTILEAYEGYSADKAGIQAGDVILSIDGKDISGKTVKSLSPYLKGEPNTELKMKVERMGVKDPLEFTLSRDEVEIANVTHAQMLDNGIGYVKFSNFRQGAANEVKTNLEKFKKEGMESFILDLRGNPGGLLNEAVSLVNLFVERQKMVVTTKGRNENNNHPYTTRGAAYDKKLPVVVLIDEGSASASEIVSGALQDYDRAVVIGNTSFGKGLVQNILPLTYNTQVKVTISKYYIPSGRCIQRIDYAQKDEDGNPIEMPDSLKEEFTTANGRKVYDGAGIDPDIEIKNADVPEIVKGLNSQYMIFDFATKYKLEHEELPGTPSDFEVSEALFSEFKSFLTSEDFQFKSKTEKAIEKVMKVAKESNLDDNIATEIAAMENKLNAEKLKQIEDNKDFIKDKLRLEIVSRYYYKKGRAEAALSNDPDIEAAKEVLLNQSKYEAVLSSPN